MNNKKLYFIEATIRSYSMDRLTLSQYASLHGQKKTAQALGICQAAICKALKARRHITVTVYANGEVKAEEIKPFPNQRHHADFAA
ncbi:Cro/CI family transcriptional regulator [Sodalis glossinidius]|uniref:Cro/CI family transcriptional regulator n=1 Tax=Sodalis glossinidius TaxID=63612 RepID=UPI001FB0C0F7|nr:Cro/CI family transcriptional regulator [Sodalis glossinidius]